MAATRTRDLYTHGHAVTSALSGGFHTALWVCGLIALAAVPIALLLIRRTDIAQSTTVSQSAVLNQRSEPAPASAD